MVNWSYYYNFCYKYKNPGKVKDNLQDSDSCVFNND
jgi:hypothetical protein